MKIKMVLLSIVVLSLLIMAGCSAKSAQQNGNGISVEMGDSLNIKNIALITYVNGKEVFSGNVINADNSSFEKGEVIWFDVSPFGTNSTVELAVSYSENINAKQSKTTNKIDISNAKNWVNVKFSKDYKINVIEME